MSQLPGFKQDVSLLVLAHLCKTYGVIVHRFDQISLSVCFPNGSCKHMISSSHGAVHMCLQALVLLFRTDTTRSCEKHERRRIMWN